MIFTVVTFATQSRRDVSMSANLESMMKLKFLVIDMFGAVKPIGIFISVANQNNIVLI